MKLEFGKYTDITNFAKKEFDLAKFYKGASVTYKNRALNLIIEKQ